ncbi:hypothetical protein LS451_06700 [Fructilactobacillus sanfranciscensis]|nr:hypothetical protein BGL41_06065 [Fructilactobacillus sanfranciscensis]POH21311.1 hypothetical protein BHU32_04400 [Fructilactobacillus sanfranciscensis DSM 20451]QFX94562.1 hypothetical protein LS451_06700 [Fructilactobacillus sanfranciscensis]RDX59812.1 hypothetical protein DXM13_01570 [Fructilactobacillus sanfranciscensis]TNK95645.1 hypothetical protein DKP74_04250 [Fructilactobacillus sanfranciscensis]
MIFLHALVGMVAFIGAGALGTSFSGQINQLSTLQKWSLITTVTTIGLTAVLGLYSVAGIPGAALSLVLLVAFEYVCLFKSAKEDA